MKGNRAVASIFRRSSLCYHGVKGEVKNSMTFLTKYRNLPFNVAVEAIGMLILYDLSTFRDGGCC